MSKKPNVKVQPPPTQSEAEQDACSLCSLEYQKIGAEKVAELLKE